MDNRLKSDNISIADDGTSGKIAVTGARVNNLKNIDVDIPHN